jgi:hypothetical protein
MLMGLLFWDQVLIQVYLVIMMGIKLDSIKPWPELRLLVFMKVIPALLFSSLDLLIKLMLELLQISLELQQLHSETFMMSPPTL